MLRYIFRRFLLMIPTLVVVASVTFFTIELPPGDWLSTHIAGLELAGETVTEAEIASLERRYGLGQPVYVRFFKWISNILLRGDFGVSFSYNRPVSSLIWGRLGLTFVLSLSSLLIHWMIAFPLGIYSAVHQYSIGDYVFTVVLKR